MNRFLIIAFMLILPIAIFTTSCGDDEDEGPTCNTTDVTYTNSVAAIFNTNCALSGCHVNNFSIGTLDSYQNAIDFASEGRIIGAINHSPGFEAMPFPGEVKLSDCDISKIETWIADGTPE